MPEPAGSKRFHILAIDDDPLVIKSVDLALREDYDIHFALRGTEGIELARALQPDLILLDVLMPELDGYEVCRMLQEDEITRHIPVLFLTALDQDEDETKGLELGAVDYLHKPVRPAITRARIALHLRLKVQQDELRRLATRDSLTGLWNRRELFSRLERELLRARREETPLAVILADVDYFKLFNDSYGHLSGDDCLREVAESLNTSLRRPADLAGRYGGEEFCCILPNTDLTGAHEVTTAIRESLTGKAIPHNASKVADCVTISMGIALARYKEEQTAEALVQEADEHLYKAKEQGRNRVFAPATEG